MSAIMNDDRKLVLAQKRYGLKKNKKEQKYSNTKTILRKI